MIDARETGILDTVVAGLPADVRKMVASKEGQLFEIRAEARSGNAIARVSAIVSVVSNRGQPYSIIVWNNEASPLPESDLDPFDLDDARDADLAYR